MKYYKFTVQMGHVGHKKYLETKIFIKSNNMINAMSQARKLPAIKHHKLPLRGSEITKAEYIDGIISNNYRKNLTSIFGELNEKNNNLH